MYIAKRKKSLGMYYEEMKIKFKNISRWRKKSLKCQNTFGCRTFYQKLKKLNAQEKMIQILLSRLFVAK